MAKIKLNKSTRRWLVDGDCSKCKRNISGTCYRPCKLSDENMDGLIVMTPDQNTGRLKSTVKSNLPISSCSKRKDDRKWRR